MENIDYFPIFFFCFNTVELVCLRIEDDAVLPVFGIGTLICFNPLLEDLVFFLIILFCEVDGWYTLDPDLLEFLPWTSMDTLLLALRLSLSDFLSIPDLAVFIETLLFCSLNSPWLVCLSVFFDTSTLYPLFTLSHQWFI